ncbi:MAG: hypothetical protein COX51_04865, partial [Syntrophobacteraceae bacterium CG23_combo_of_CG06-09_8_20_14_all_50_8]
MTYGIAFLRWIGYFISALPLYIGFLWVAFDGKKQGWHDKLAGTVVILVNNDEHRMPPSIDDDRPSPPETETI